MIKVEDALKTILKSVRALPKEKVKLTEGLNRVLAEDIYASISVPQLDNSAMDGYAVKSRDTSGASGDSPKMFDVTHDLRAGFLTSKAIREHQAIRIMTGAAIPKGADSVVMVEYTKKIQNPK